MNAQYLNKIKKLRSTKQFNIAVAESCTGGMLSSKLSSLNGSSAFFLGSIIAYSNKLKIKLSSQDVSMYKEGAYTGEVSSTQLEKLDISYSIIGHSERRTLLNENDEIINQKLKRLLEQRITPIFCFGEPIENRENNTYLEFI